MKKENFFLVKFLPNNKNKIITILGEKSTKNKKFESQFKFMIFIKKSVSYVH